MKSDTRLVLTMLRELLEAKRESVAALHALLLTHEVYECEVQCAGHDEPKREGW